MVIKQMQFDIKPHGGRRKGAGRKNLVGEGIHGKRPHLLKRHPIHINVKLKPHLPNLRSPRLFASVKKAIHYAKQYGLRVVHFSVLKNHIHLIVEVSGKTALIRGMRSFTSRLGRTLRTFADKMTLDKIGQRTVFQGRYHVEVLKTPRQVRSAIRYVLLNPSKHSKKRPYFDKYTSSFEFSSWDKLVTKEELKKMRVDVLEGMGLPSEYREASRDNKGNPPDRSFKIKDILSFPEEWLLSVGWMRAKF